MAVVTTRFGLQHLTIGDAASGKDCMLINCKLTLNQSVAELEPPKYDLILASDLALDTQIYYVFDKTVNGTLQSLTNAATVTQQLYQENLQLIDQLSQLNYSVQLAYQYQNFSDMRKAVDEIINNISPVDPQGLSFDGCGLGVFGSISCFFSNIGSTIVTILIIAAILVGIYIVCFKLGIAKKLTSKVMGK